MRSAVRVRWAIIGLALGLLLAGLGGCSALRLAYGQAPGLAYWWLDAYVDFDGAQTTVVRRGLDDWFAWHRRSEVPTYVAMLERMRSEAVAETTPARICAWWDDVQQRRTAALRQASGAATELALLIGPQQVSHLEREFAKRNAEARDEFMDENPEERAEAALKRAVDRAESLYGALDGEQRRWLAGELARSPWNPAGFLAERERRQQRILALLRPWSVRGGKPAPEVARREVQQLLDTYYTPPSEAARREQAAVREFNCGLFARFHNRTTAEQRSHLAAKFADWAADLRLVQAETVPG
jgi:hypothetical protein